MMNNKVTRIIANSVGLAAVAALGITVYQLGTSPVKEKTPDNVYRKLQGHWIIEMSVKVHRIRKNN